MGRQRERWDELREQFLGDFGAGVSFAERSAHADAWASYVADLEAARDHWKGHIREVEAICAEYGVGITQRVFTEDRVRLVLQRLEARVAELEAAAVADAPPGVGDRSPSTEEFVHLCSWSGQPDLYIPCAQLWTTPFWHPERLPTLPPGVFYAEHPAHAEEVWRRYAFEVQHVTCPACLEALRTGTDQPQNNGGGSSSGVRSAAWVSDPAASSPALPR